MTENTSRLLSKKEIILAFFLNSLLPLLWIKLYIYVQAIPLNKEARGTAVSFYVGELDLAIAAILGFSIAGPFVLLAISRRLKYWFAATSLCYGLYLTSLLIWLYSKYFFIPMDINNLYEFDEFLLTVITLIFYFYYFGYIFVVLSLVVMVLLEFNEDAIRKGINNSQKELTP